MPDYNYLNVLSICDLPELQALEDHHVAEKKFTSRGFSRFVSKMGERSIVLTPHEKAPAVKLGLDLLEFGGFTPSANTCHRHPR